MDFRGQSSICNGGIKMVANVGDVIKYHIDFIEEGLCIQQGKVCKIKEGLFSKKYLVEVIRTSALFDNNIRARWVNGKNIIEILKQKDGVI